MNTPYQPRRRERNNERITITMTPSLYDAIQQDAFRLHTTPPDFFRGLYRSWKQAQQEEEKSQAKPGAVQEVKPVAVAEVKPEAVEVATQADVPNEAGMGI